MQKKSLPARVDGVIRRFSSGGQFEKKVGYSRAVTAGGWVHVAGTTAQGDVIPDDIIGQCKAALAAIKDALEQAGCGFEHVVRVTYILSDASEFEPCWPLLAQTFGDHPPAATMIESGLIDPKYRIEIEVTAYCPDAG